MMLGDDPRLMFWVDITALLPWDIIVMAILGVNADTDGQPGSSVLPSYIAVLKWLTLLRFYRVVEVFTRQVDELWLRVRGY